MNIKKISILVSLIFTLSLQVFSQNSGRMIIPESNLKFKANADYTEVSITGFIVDPVADKKFKDKILEIPSKIQGVPVISVTGFEEQGSYYYYNEKGEYCTWNISGFWIPEGVKTIKKSAFSRSKVDTIHLPDSLQYIEDYAFSSCKAKEINIPSSVISIGDGAFTNTSGIHELVLPENVIIYSHAFYDTTITRVTFPKGPIQVIYSWGYSKDEYCFIYSDKLEELIIPEEFVLLYFKAGADITSYIKGKNIDTSFAFQKQLKTIPVKNGNTVLEQEYFKALKACDFKKAMKIAADIPIKSSEFEEYWRKACIAEKIAPEIKEMFSPEKKFVRYGDNECRIINCNCIDTYNQTVLIDLSDGKQLNIERMEYEKKSKCCCR